MIEELGAAEGFIMQAAYYELAAFGGGYDKNVNDLKLKIKLQSIFWLLILKPTKTPQPYIPRIKRICFKEKHH